MLCFKSSWTKQNDGYKKENNSIFSGKLRQYLYVSSSTKKATFIRFWLSAENTRRGNYLDIARIFRLGSYWRERRAKLVLKARPQLQE